MKFPKALLLLFIAILPLTGRAANRDSVIKVKPDYPILYLGFSVGINNPVGFFGPQMDIIITKKVSAGTGIGLSTWGNKMFVEGRYYFDQYNRGWAVATGLTYSVGHKGLKLPGVKTVYGEQEVVVDQDPQTNAMVSTYYFFPMGKKKKTRFHLQAGYSIPLTEKGSFSCDEPLTSDGVNQIRYLAPGGFMVGAGFSF